MKWNYLSLLIVIVIGVTAAATVWKVSQLNTGAIENNSVIIPANTNLSNTLPTTTNSSTRNSTTSSSPTIPAVTNVSDTTTTNINTNSADANTNAVITGNEDFEACSSDAHTYCSGFYSADWEAYATANGYRTGSWKYGLVDCLGAHRDQTTQACDDSFDRRQQLNDDLVTACESDRGQFCKGIKPQPGSEPMVDCLEEHYSQLSADCAAAFDAHAAAKPTQ